MVHTHSHTQAIKKIIKHTSKDFLRGTNKEIDPLHSHVCTDPHTMTQRTNTLQLTKDDVQQREKPPCQKTSRSAIGSHYLNTE